VLLVDEFSSFFISFLESPVPFTSFSSTVEISFVVDPFLLTAVRKDIAKCFDGIDDPQVANVQAVVGNVELDDGVLGVTERCDDDTNLVQLELRVSPMCHAICDILNEMLGDSSLSAACIGPGCARYARRNHCRQYHRTIPPASAPHRVGVSPKKSTVKGTERVGGAAV
jgi:hypothetical protein